MKLNTTFGKILLATVAIATATLGTTAHAYDFDDRVEAKMHQDVNFDATVAKAVKMLEAKGYTVQNVEADSEFGKPVLEVEAYKNYQEYDIKLSYPELKILKERRDD